MMTMATLMAGNDPPWCHNTITCTTKAPKPQQESSVSKVGIHSIDSHNNHLLNILRKIPTRISPSSPTAAVTAHHANDDDQTPHVKYHCLPPPSTVHNCSPQLTSHQSATDEPFDNQSKLDENKAALERLKSRWPSLFAIPQDPCNPSQIALHQPSPPPLPPQSLLPMISH